MSQFYRVVHITVDFKNEYVQEFTRKRFNDIKEAIAYYLDIKRGTYGETWAIMVDDGQLTN